jgi:hypothetical protein
MVWLFHKEVVDVPAITEGDFFEFLKLDEEKFRIRNVKDFQMMDQIMMKLFQV